MGRVDSKLTSEIIRILRKEFPRHYVTVDRARLISGQSITIDGLRIAKSTDQGLRDVVRLGRIVCNGPIDLVGLAQGQLPVDRVVIDSADLSFGLSHQAAGIWKNSVVAGRSPKNSQPLKSDLG